MAIGLSEDTARTHIGQYEINYRVPKPQMLIEIACVLQGNTRPISLSKMPTCCKILCMNCSGWTRNILI